MSELARAYVQIIPSADGISGGIASALVPEASSAGDEAGQEAGNNLASKIKTALAAAGIGVAIKQAFSALDNFAGYGDTIDKQSQKIGISTKAYQEWSAVLQHSGTNINVMQSAMKKLSNAAVDGSDAFQKLGISQEEAASMSQEDLFARVIEGLQGMEEGSERAALAQDLLGRGAQEMAALLNTSAEDTQAMKDRVNELGGVMSEDAVKAAASYKDSLQDMKTAISGVGFSIAGEFLPGITQVMDGIAQIFSGDAEGGLGMITAGITGLATTITESIPAFAEAALGIISSIGQAIMDNLPSLWAKGTEIVGNLAQGFLDNLPSIISAGGQMLNNLLNYIMQNLPSFISSGINLIGRLAMGIIRALPQIIGSMARVLAQLLATIVRNLPQMLRQGMQLIVKLASGVIRAIPQVVRTVPQIFGRIAGAFRGLNWGSIGRNLINGIKNGISNGASAVVNAAKNLAKNAFNAAKNFLGISSPSKKFKWIAEMSTEGIVRGTDKGIPKVVDMATEMARAAVGAFNDNYALQSQGATFTAPEPVLASAGGSYTISVPLNIDGRAFARATATYTQTELDRLGTQKNRRAGL
jgi:hypothetical protein